MNPGEFTGEVGFNLLVKQTTKTRVTDIRKNVQFLKKFNNEWLRDDFLKNTKIRINVIQILKV